MLLVLRCLYGIGMGGEWGLGASLAMEKIPVEKRGFFSGVLQQGYPVGYLFAAHRLLHRHADRRLARAVHRRARSRRCWRCSSACASSESRGLGGHQASAERQTKVGFREVLLQPRDRCGASSTSCC